MQLLKPSIGFVVLAVSIALGAARGAAAQEVDFGGEWAPLYHEDGPERLPGPELGDYTGMPVLSRHGADHLSRWASASV